MVKRRRGVGVGVGVGQRDRGTEGQRDRGTEGQRDAWELPILGTAFQSIIFRFGQGV